MATDKFTIDPPAITAPTGGLLSVATITTGAPSFAFHKGVEYHKRHDAEFLVYGQNNEAVNGKTIVNRTSNTLVESNVITAYAGLEVLLFDREDGKAQLADAFTRNESRSLEKVFQTQILNTGTDLTPTPGTAVTNPRLAVGLLEQWFGANYGGRPVLHTSRLGANLLEDLLETDASRMHTAQGSPVGYGSGYRTAGPNARTAGAGQAWVYVTGDVEFLRSQVAVEEEGLRLPGNRVTYLTEVQYIPLVNGPVGAILIGA